MIQAMATLAYLLENHPGWKLLSQDKLCKLLVHRGIKFDKAEVEKHYGSSELCQVYKQRGTKPKLFRTTAATDCYQIDVVLMSEFKSSNKNLDKFLFIVDILSRRAHAYVLPSGSMTHVLDQYARFLRDIREHDRIRPGSVSGDAFFDAAEFRKYNAERFIAVHTCVATNVHAMRHGSRLGLLDRAVRTIKLLMKKHITDTDDPRWTMHLDGIVQLYNDTPHSSLDNRPPSDAYKDRVFLRSMHARDRSYNTEIHNLVNVEFVEGDRVRIAVPKSAFSKEKAQFSRELYTVREPKGHGFLLLDEAGHPVDQSYMARDLQKVDEVVDRLIVDRVGRSMRVNKASRKLAYTEGLHVTAGSVAGVVHNCDECDAPAANVMCLRDRSRMKEPSMRVKKCSKIKKIRLDI